MFNSNLSDIQARLENWWNCGDQDTPCIIIQTLKDGHPPLPDTDDLTRYWTDPEFIIRRSIARIDHSNYYGQSVPHHYLDFSASAMNGVLGGRLEYIDKETIWAHPHLKSVEQVADITLDENNPWYKTILDVARQSAKLADNHHFIAPYALEGMTDILAGLYGVENFMMDLALNPDNVKHAMAHVKNLWIQAFNDLQAIIAPANSNAGIGWAGIWAPGTTFPLQEDVSYMISADMFREFCLPHIADLIDLLEYPFYHLDGIGAIPHLDILLEIGPLKAIQWQPGAGKERLDQWYDLIKKIIRRGKSVQVYASPDEVVPLVKNVGPKGLLVSCERATNDQARQLIEKFS